MHLRNGLEIEKMAIRANMTGLAELSGDTRPLLDLYGRENHVPV